MGKTARRQFIKQSGFTMLTVGLSGPAFFCSLNLAANSALTQASALSTNDNVLVVIQLAGGNDSINTVVPRSGRLRSEYESLRGATLAVPVADLLPVNQSDAAGNWLGFHPRLAHIKALYDQGRVGVIQAVGYPDPDYSHFRSMDIWHTAKQKALKPTGWLGDYLDATVPSNENPLTAVSIGNVLPLSLHTATLEVSAIASIESHAFQTDAKFAGDANNRVETFLALNQEGAPERVLYDQIRLTALDAYQSSQELQTGIGRYTTDPAIVYNPQNPLAQALQQVARILAGDLGTKILYVSLGGFDTHQRQVTTDGPLTGVHATLLGYVSEAVDVFYRDLVRLGLDHRVLMMAWSEFGRKVRENGNEGTDHGASGTQFVFGTPVRGGIIGEHPSLTDVYPGQDSTRHSIDFRQIYATILDRWLGVDHQVVLGQRFELVPFI